MAGLLLRVRTKMSIYAHRKTLDLLEGGYASVHRGRSHDFDDLRAYVPGDEVKDIDWKATARHNEPLVKRYIASRRHQLVLLVDTGRNMAATAESGESKKDIAVMASGALAWIAAQHGDVVSLVVGDEKGTRSYPAGQRDEHLERLLRAIDERVTLTAPRSDVRGLLDSVARGLKTRSMLLIVTDDVRIGPEHEATLRRLRAKHEILWLTIGDADLMRRDETSGEVYDVQEVAALPAYVRGNKRLRALFEETAVQTLVDTEQQLRQLGVTSHRIASQTDVVPGLFALLEKHRRAER
ncbi:hypothetical protein AX769_14530 [Frondihabitans sp. PAMC 28766]|uniref:DUF58 domain-containing protein n=1 Tax=Frondihabitans sp. PAMC 28766 TaxID=1795630 RepID=UPI00078B1EE6|nr:DUF58 domain-containing protein [Frondihabitans sp. PAMC 28766]AMM21132.1 hypothetical protein AX769_14530 [Frondihabitans sp. PAMC 28766]